MLFKLLGLVILTMMVLVLISILEVAVYSYLINPGQPEAVYEAHANASAPYISAIFGFVVFFLVARYWKQKSYEQVAKLVFLFPLTYIVLDSIIITTAGVNWADFIWVFAIANASKCVGSYLGYRLT